MQKFTANYRLTEIRDEIYRIIRIEVLQKRGKWISDEDKERIKRKLKLQNFLKNIESFAEEISQKEDEILLEIYGKSSSENQRYGEEITTKEKQFQAYLFELLKFQYENPNRIRLAFFGENANELSVFLRRFAMCFRDADSEIRSGLLFTTEKQKDQAIKPKTLFDRVVYRKEITDAKDFKGSINQEILGVLLEIEGELALPRFGAETGLHRFVHATRTHRILINSTAAAFDKYVLPDELMKRDSIKFQTERRVYDFTKNIIKDLILGKTFSLETIDLQKVISEAIESNLIKTAESLIE